MATFWEIAAHSVDRMFSLYFGFEGWIGVLIASVPDFCILFTLSKAFTIRCLDSRIFPESDYQISCI